MRERVLLRDTSVANIDPSDGRHIEVVATGLPLAHGIPLAVDCTVVAPLHPFKTFDVSKVNQQ